LKTLIGNGTFELSYGTAAESRTTTDAMEKGQSARALQQRIQPKRDLYHLTSRKRR
jgi:hypothetical protein